MKCCPKCSSTETNPAVFYRPSIWVCLDCDYEGAFIIEPCGLAEETQGSLESGPISIGMAPLNSSNHLDSSADAWPKT